MTQFKRIGMCELRIVLTLFYYSILTNIGLALYIMEYRGHDIYTNGPAEGAGGGFPSGGHLLPSLSLIPVQKHKAKEGEVGAGVSLGVVIPLSILFFAAFF